MNLREYGLVLAFVGTVGIVSGIDLTAINLQHYYDKNAPFHVTGKLRFPGESIRISLNLSLLAPQDSTPSLLLYFQQGYEDNSLSANTPFILNEAQKINDKRYVYVHELPDSSSADLLVIGIVHTDLKTYYWDIPLKHSLNFEPAEFEVYSTDSILYFSPYYSEGNRLLFSRDDLIVFQYQEDFPPATPPMADNQAVSQSIRVDSVFTSRNGLLVERNKLYFIQDDTTSLKGTSLLGVPLRYPKLSAVADLLEPLVYISTRSEYEKIESAQSLKPALDRFWLDVTGHKGRAVTTIRAYYQRISDAGRYFTTYKSGWKTDMGMVYVLFGLPTRVYRNANTERWIFENLTGQSATFTFVKIKNIFTSSHYVLERGDDYKALWFKQVDLWRKGKI